MKIYILNQCRLTVGNKNYKIGLNNLDQFNKKKEIKVLTIIVIYRILVMLLEVDRKERSLITVTNQQKKMIRVSILINLRVGQGYLA